MTAYTEKILYRGVPGTTSTVLYTVPAATTTIVKEITFANTTAANASITVRMAGTPIVSGLIVPPEGSTAELSSVMDATEEITALQVTASAIELTISGIEIA